MDKNMYEQVLVTNWILFIMEGFKDGVNACCGSGPYGGMFSCGGSTKDTEFSLCDNAGDHVWWDSFHPTQNIHQQFAKALWDGPSSSVGPYNLKQLFSNNEITLTIADVVDAPQNQQHSFTVWVLFFF